VTLRDEVFEHIASPMIEGGDKFTDDPEDPGGPTKWGLSLMAARLVRSPNGDLIFDKDADGDVDVEDVRIFERSDAERWFDEEVWKPLRCDEIDAGWAWLLADFGFNAGRGAAAIIAQRTVGAKQDGVVGPKTVALLAPWTLSGDRRELVRFTALRLQFYRMLKREKVERFFVGWAARACSTLLRAAAATNP